MTERYDFIISTIKEAGELLVSETEKGFEVSSKGGDTRNVLTEVDLKVDEFLKNKIKEKYPEEKIYSEEGGDSFTEGSIWSLDPIDGTSNFARAIPHFAIVVAFVENGEAVVGAIFNPITRELFSFEKGSGVFLNNKPIQTSDIKNIKDSYVLLHIGRKENIQDWGLRLQKKFLSSAKKNANLGSSALDLAFLASGRVDAVIYGTMTTLDIAVALSMVRLTGGEIYNLDGTPVVLSDSPQQIIATSTKELFEEISSI
jgi:myo-inositol-1(or 4)-monophosphatase